MSPRTRKTYRVPAQPARTVAPFEHPYADCTRCGGTDLASSSYSSVKDPCSWCIGRFYDESRVIGIERAAAKQRAMAIEQELLRRYDVTRVVKSHAKRVKPLDAADAAWVQAYHLSDLNREYLHCLTVFWS